MNYRVIKAEEIEKLIPLAEEFHENEVLASWCSFDPEVWVKAWTALLKQGAAFVLISEDDDGITGAMGGLVYPDVNDGVLVCQESFWFVPRDKRGGGPALLREYEELAADIGVKRSIMNHLADSRAKHIARFYERAGYQPLESSYYKELV